MIIPNIDQYHHDQNDSGGAAESFAARIFIEGGTTGLD